MKAPINMLLKLPKSTILWKSIQIYIYMYIAGHCNGMCPSASMKSHNITHARTTESRSLIKPHNLCGAMIQARFVCWSVHVCVFFLIVSFHVRQQFVRVCLPLNIACDSYDMPHRLNDLVVRWTLMIWLYVHACHSQTELMNGRWVCGFFRLACECSSAIVVKWVRYALASHCYHAVHSRVCECVIADN